jgi:neutral trehalase
MTSISSHIPAASFFRFALLFILLVVFVVSICSVLFFVSDSPASLAEPLNHSYNQLPSYSCPIQCHGELLSIIQLSGLFSDSKEFVDLPLLRSPESVLDEFALLKQTWENKNETIPLEELKSFVSSCFGSAGSDLSPWIPPDFPIFLPFYNEILDEKFRFFGQFIHENWKLLGRKIKSSVYHYPEKYTLLTLKHPYMIVPGGRFREIYYWDSWWIMRGLSRSGMKRTALLTMENFISLISIHGFIPNGCRKYYLKRSQPPLATFMAYEILKEKRAEAETKMNETNQSKQFLSFVFPALLMEYFHWMNPLHHAVNVSDEKCCNRKEQDAMKFNKQTSKSVENSWTKNSLSCSDELRHLMTLQADENVYQFDFPSSLQFDSFEFARIPDPPPLYSGFLLNRYYSNVKHPRPESYREDFQTAQQLEKILNHSGTANISQSIHSLFSELAASAESGWDFSSRWFQNRLNLTTAYTSLVIPVDLNAFLFRNERILALFADILGYQKWNSFFNEASERRFQAIQHYLWDNEYQQWRDYVIDKNDPIRRGETAVLSNWIPLWVFSDPLAGFTNGFPDSINPSSIIDSLLHSGLLLPGGFTISLNNDGQQWDYPNAWAPMQDIITSSIGQVGYHYQPANEKTRKLLKEIGSQLSGEINDPDNRGVFSYGSILKYYIQSRWCYSNYLAFSSTGRMFEKYYAPVLGVAGYGGEYQVQAGFGWTNAVILDFLYEYRHHVNLTFIQDLPGPLALI